MSGTFFSEYCEIFISDCGFINDKWLRCWDALSRRGFEGRHIICEGGDYNYNVQYYFNKGKLKKFIQEIIKISFHQNFCSIVRKHEIERFKDE